MADFINTTPQVLKSIRESLQMNLEEASKLSKIPIERIKQFEETNNIKPSLEELKSLAKAYKKSLAELLLYNPIKHKPLPKDRRTIKSEQVGIFDLKTIKIVERARALLDSLLRLKKELGINIVKFSENASLNDDPVSIANKFREKWRLNELKGYPNSDDALEGFIEKIEELGVAVFQLPLTKDNLRGFSITDEEIPIIVIKRGDPATAKIFTLFHEVGHLLLNESGICDIGLGSQQKIEKWCNAFASEILVPTSQLLQNSIIKKYVSEGKKEWSSKDLFEIGNEFFVGRLVILKKLYDLGLTNKQYYEEKLNSWNKPVFGKAKEPKGRNIPKEIVQERGKTFISLVFNAYYQNKINIKELSDYLGVKLAYIPKIREHLFG